MRALVTGGATGIGKATVERLARDRFEVAIHAHTHASEAEELARRLRDSGVDSFAVSADLSNPEQVRRLAAAVSQRWEQLDVLVHNAGAYPRSAFEDLRWQDWEKLFRANVFAAAELTRELLPLLRRAKNPSVVLVASQLAFSGSGHGAHYSASKGALIGLAYSMARELAPHIRVNAVAPGSIETAILAGDTSAKRAERERAIPLGRVGSAMEVAEAITYLASGSSSYVTGTTLHVNGGSRIG